MRIFYTSQDGYVGAHFIGKSDRINGLVKSRGFEFVSDGQITGPIYRLALSEGEKRCEVTISYSNRRKGIRVLAASNNREYLSNRLEEILKEVNASDLSKKEHQQEFVAVKPMLMAYVHEFATGKKYGDNHAGT